MPKRKKKNKAIAWQRVYFDMGNLTILKACTAPENFFKGEGVSESFFCPGGWGRGNFNKKKIIKLHSQIITLYFPSWSLHVKVNSHLDLKSCSLNRVSHFANICSCQYMALWEEFYSLFNGFYIDILQQVKYIRILTFNR